MRRLNRGLFQVTMSKVALENDEVVPAETAVADAVETPATDTATVTAAEVPTDTGTVEVTVTVDTQEPVVIEKTETAETPEVTTTVSAEVTEPVEAPTTTGTDVVKTDTVAEEGVTGALIGAAAGMAGGPVGGAVAGHFAEKKIKELEAEIARLKKQGRPATEDNDADSEVTTTSVVDETPVVTEPTETPVAVPEGASAVVDETPAAEPTKTEETVSEGETVLVKTEGGEVVATINTTETGTTVSTSEVTVEVEKTGDSTSVEVTVTPDETSAISTEDLTVIETDGNQTEVEIQDAVDCAEDTAELVSEIDEAEEAAMTLESFADIAAAAASNGGLDSNGARLLKVATEHIYNHMSLGKAVGIPAMESFEIPGARASATTIALEDIREQAKKVWQAIVNGIKKAAEWIMEFVKKILSANQRIKARAEKLLAVKDKLLSSPKASKVGNGALVKTLIVGGRVPSNMSAEVKKAVDFFFRTVGSRSVEAMINAVDMIAAAKTTDNVEKAEKLVFDGMEAVIGGSLQFNNVANSIGAKMGVEEAPEGTSISMSTRFAGEQAVWAYIPKTVKAISSFRSGICMDTTSVSKIADTAKANTLSPSDIIGVANEALKFVEISKEFEKLMGPINDVTKKIAVVVTSISNTTDTQEARLETMIPALRAIRNMVKGLHQPAAVVTARVVNAALNLATESAKQYSMKSA